MNEAKSRLSQLVEKVLCGEQVIIAKSGKPLVEIIPFKPQANRVFGQFKNEFEMADDFDGEQINDDIADLFESESDLITK